MGGIGAAKSRSGFLVNRDRWSRYNQAAIGQYEQASQAGMDEYARAASRAREGTRQRLNELRLAEANAGQDIKALLAQQIASNRTGAQSSFAQSSGAPAVDQTAYSGAQLSSAAMRTGFGVERGRTIGSGVAQENSATQMLAQALTQRAAFRYGHQQSIANFYGSRAMGTPMGGGIGMDLGGLAMMGYSMFGGQPGAGAPGGGGTANLSPGQSYYPGLSYPGGPGTSQTSGKGPVG